jgi:hypothetical protein
MATFVLTYRGGAIAAGDAAMAAAMEQWERWFASVGDAVVDWGSPFGPSATVSPDGSVATGAASSLTGYSIIAAHDLDAANEMAKSCPVLRTGGSVDVYEVAPIG